jgi:hypothetical protein|tara:strand:- start:814 stop:1053 length:240 start_codon:yes stop_codon:yes gene_type:complete
MRGDQSVYQKHSCLGVAVVEDKDGVVGVVVRCEIHQIMCDAFKIDQERQDQIKEMMGKQADEERVEVYSSPCFLGEVDQ